MDYSNGYIFPKDYRQDQAHSSGQNENADSEKMAQALEISAAQDQASANTVREDEDRAMLAVAIQVCPLIEACLKRATHHKGVFGVLCSHKDVSC